MIHIRENEGAGVPVGTFVAFHASLGSEFIDDDFMACDGSTVTLTDSPMYGQVLPDLNSQNRYLRGSTTAGTLTGSNANHNHTLPTWPVAGDNQGGPYPMVYSSGLVMGTASREPAYINVQWYIKVR